MIGIDIRGEGPLICNSAIAEEILDRIIKEDPINNKIIICMEGIVSITVQCINIIFGRLYDILGHDKFLENIVFQDCSEGLCNLIEFVLNERNNN